MTTLRPRLLGPARLKSSFSTRNGGPPHRLAAIDRRHGHDLLHRRSLSSLEAKPLRGRASARRNSKDWANSANRFQRALARIAPRTAADRTQTAHPRHTPRTGWFALRTDGGRGWSAHPNRTSVT